MERIDVLASPYASIALRRRGYEHRRTIAASRYLCGSGQRRIGSAKAGWKKRKNAGGAIGATGLNRWSEVRKRKATPLPGSAATRVDIRPLTDICLIYFEI